MKNLIIFGLFFISSATLCAQQNIIWEDEIIVASATEFGNVRPRLTLGADNRAMIIMTRSQNGQIYFTRENNNQFSTPLPLLPSTLQSYIASWTGPDMEAKGDTIVIVFKSKPYEEGHIYAVRSTDGGLTFSDTIRADNHDVGLAWMPSMTMDNNGNPIVTYMAHDANYTNSRYVYVKSNDAGLSYLNEQVITSAISGEACDCCPAEMVADNTKQVLLFRNNEMNIRDIYGVYSEDGGVSFSSNSNVDQTAWLVNSCPSSGPHAMINGSNLFTTFMSAANGIEQVYVSRSTLNGGLNFQERQAISITSGQEQNFPRIAVENNLLVVTWAERVSNNYEVFTAFAYDNDLSQLNSTHQQVNINTNGTQTNPDIRIKDGYIHLVYQDGSTGKVMYRRGQMGYLGIQDIDKTEGLLSPNPVLAGENLSLPLELINGPIDWVDLTGKVVYSSGVVNENQIITTPNLESGTYFIQTNKSRKSFRIIIQ